MQKTLHDLTISHQFLLIMYSELNQRVMKNPSLYRMEELKFQKSNRKCKITKINWKVVQDQFVVFEKNFHVLRDYTQMPNRRTGTTFNFSNSSCIPPKNRIPKRPFNGSSKVHFWQFRRIPWKQQR